MTFFNADTTVWGTGLLLQENFKQIIDQSKKRKLDIRAVRGPVTRSILLAGGYNCPEVYGDPAILMPLIYNVPVEKEYDVTYFPHHSRVDCGVHASNMHILNTHTRDHKHFIDEIRKSKIIISSSLHGIILAEAYGVPAVWLNEVHAQMWKFFDWYWSTERYNVKMAGTIEEALCIIPMKTPYLDDMQKRLIETFPYDLWRQ